MKYRTRAITTRGLYLFYPIFHCGLYLRAVYTAERLVFTWIFFHLWSPQIFLDKSKQRSILSYLRVFLSSTKVFEPLNLGYELSTETIYRLTMSPSYDCTWWIFEYPKFYKSFNSLKFIITMTKGFKWK